MQREKLEVQQERAVLATALLPGNSADPHDPLGELRSLAHSAGAVVVDELLQNRHKPAAATFLGSGKVNELGEMVKAHKADVIIFDNDLTPSQIGKIEQITECKVLDRSELILDIFAARARTHEAKLQVELAQLEYTYPRLRAMWAHLERIGGGSPAGIGTRGPGEQQLEVDRRIVQRKKAELRKEIAAIQKRKEREVSSRNKDHFTVSLVGYTNAGKSTLFNTATDGDAYADDKLFATLSTRTRQWKLGGGDSVMLSDTVGFVRDLPHHLVASFKATLQEAVHSDLLLIVLDVSHPRAQMQLDTVMAVLDDIEATGQDRQLILNKVDLLEHNGPLLLFQKEHPQAITLSAKTGENLAELIERIRDASHGKEHHLKLAIEMSQGKAINYIETRTQVIDREYAESEVIYTTIIGQRQLDQLRAMGAPFKIVGDTTATDASLQPSGWTKEDDDGPDPSTD